MNIDALPVISEATSLSPFSKLPDDVLFEIFHVSTRSLYSPALQPVVLSQVCRAWRTLTWEASTLWNHVLIIEHLEECTTEFDKTLCRVSHFLALSGACPLSFEICMCSWDQHTGELDDENPYCVNLDAYRERIRALSSLISRHVSRIKEFNLTCDEFDTVIDLFSAIPPHIPMCSLEKLSIYNLDEEQVLEEDLNEPSDIGMLSILLRPYDNMTGEEAAAALYPKLKSVTLHGAPLEWARFCPRNLNQLDIGYLPMNARPSDAVLRKILLGSQHSLRSLSLLGAVVGGRRR